MVLQEATASLFRGRAEVQGGVVFFRRCPAGHLTRFTHAMLRWFMWLDQWGVTPFHLGANGEDLDPRFFPAMETLKVESERVKTEELERIRSQNKD